MRMLVCMLWPQSCNERERLRLHPSGDPPLGGCLARASSGLGTNWQLLAVQGRRAARLAYM